MADRPSRPPRNWWLPELWVQYRELSRDFWIFFTASLLYEAGFGLYFFLFNLYLLDLHFDEKAIGFINGALSLGQLATTLPVGILSRKFGNRRLLLFCFVMAPLLCVLRALWMWEPAQIGLAFTAGLVMSIWTVCFLPISASLTSESNRASAIGLIFSVGIGATALGSAGSGYLSHWIGLLSPGFGAADVKRAVLLISCAIAFMGSLPLLRLPDRRPSLHAPASVPVLDRRLLSNTFLRRYLPCMALWTSLLATFSAFAGVYFVRERHLAFTQIGLIFSVSQTAQLVAGLLIPIMVSRWGMMRAILVTQLGTPLLLIAVVSAVRPGWSVAAYAAYAATQWMSSTTIYTLLMNAIPEVDRSVASAMTMFSNSLAIACATSAVGALLVRFHYTPVLLVMACLEALLAILFQVLLRDRRARPVVTQALCTEISMD
jgi:MFS family permease